MMAKARRNPKNLSQHQALRLEDLYLYLELLQKEKVEFTFPQAKVDKNEKTVTTNIIEHIKPRIRDIEKHSKVDLRQIVREEVANQREAADEDANSESPVEESSTNIQGEPE